MIVIETVPFMGQNWFRLAMLESAPKLKADSGTPAPTAEPNCSVELIWMDVTMHPDSKPYVVPATLYAPRYNRPKTHARKAVACRVMVDPAGAASTAFPIPKA